MALYKYITEQAAFYDDKKGVADNAVNRFNVTGYDEEGDWANPYTVEGEHEYNAVVTGSAKDDSSPLTISAGSFTISDGTDVATIALTGSETTIEDVMEAINSELVSEGTTINVESHKKEFPDGSNDSFLVLRSTGTPGTSDEITIATTTATLSDFGLTAGTTNGTKPDVTMQDKRYLGGEFLTTNEIANPDLPRITVTTIEEEIKNVSLIQNGYTQDDIDDGVVPATIIDTTSTFVETVFDSTSVTPISTFQNSSGAHLYKEGKIATEFKHANEETVGAVCGIASGTMDSILEITAIQGNYNYTINLNGVTLGSLEESVPVPDRLNAARVVGSDVNESGLSITAGSFTISDGVNTATITLDGSESSLYDIRPKIMSAMLNASPGQIFFDVNILGGAIEQNHFEIISQKYQGTPDEITIAETTADVSDFGLATGTTNATVAETFDDQVVQHYADASLVGTTITVDMVDGVTTNGQIADALKTISTIDTVELASGDVEDWMNVWTLGAGTDTVNLTGGSFAYTFTDEFGILEPTGTVSDEDDATLLIYDDTTLIAYADENGDLQDKGSYLDSGETNTVNYSTGVVQFTLDYAPSTPLITITYQSLTGAASAWKYEPVSTTTEERAADATNLDKHIEDVLAASKAFGASLVDEFTTENVLMGITASGQTNAVRKALYETWQAIETGSLHDAIYEAEQVTRTSPFLTETRLRAFINELESYLGLPLSS